HAVAGQRRLSETCDHSRFIRGLTPPAHLPARLALDLMSFTGRGLFITGTDTGVGKTYVACLMARALRNEGLRVGVYKPVASGCRLKEGRLVSDDALAL